VLAAAVVAGARGTHLPFTAAAPPALGVNGTPHPFAAAGALWQALSSQPVLLFEAVVLAATAAVLPRLQRRWIALFGLLLLAGVTAPDPALPDAAIVATVVATCVALAVKAES
jgi:hypothetical protein